MNLKFTILFFCTLLPAILFSQGIRGIVTDEQNTPLPNVSIYIPDLMTGTTSNLNGNYEIELPKGEYLVIFQSLGFKRREYKLTIRDTWVELDLSLEPQNFRLPEVVVNPSGEDPAYAIMRKAIDMAPYYLRQTKQYTAEVYLKGSFRMDKIPRLLRKSLTVKVNDTEVPLEEGRTYTMESMNQIHFIAPDTFNHTVLASRTSFPAGDESVALGFINSSFYDADNGMIISPLAPQAMKHYKFRYEGYFEEGDVEVDKIKVIPKRKSQQLVSGYIYIVHNLWNLHSVDLTAQAFWGTININQLFQPVEGNAWLPVTHQFDLDLKVMGVKAVVDYSGSVKYTDVALNDAINFAALTDSNPASFEEKPYKEPSEAEAKENKNKEKIDRLLSKNELSNREMMKLARLMEKETKEEEPVSLEQTSTYHLDVKKDSIKRDSTFWNTIRPVPLTPIEHQSFVLADSLKASTHNSNDTISWNKPGPVSKTLSLLTSNQRLYMADSTLTLDYKGLIRPGNLGFNPVDGWKYKQSFQLRWKQDSARQLIFTPEATWAFAREKLMWNATLTQNYAPLLRGLLSVEAGDQTSAFKPAEVDIAPFSDMVASLFFKENYKRYYGQQYVHVRNGIDLTNGLRWDFSAGYEWISPRFNHTNYSFFKKEEYYHFNLPENNAAKEIHLKEQNSLIWHTALTYTPQYFYRIEKGKKIMTHSRYPTFGIALTQGIKAMDSDADYLLLEASAQHMKETTLFPTFSWRLAGGWFVRNESLHFSQFKHFNASSIPVRITGGQAFRLINDYEASTNEWYAISHLQYSSPYLLLKNLPLLSNRLWQESLHVDYLHTPQLNNYVQAGYSLDQIFLMGSLGVFVGFEDGKYRHWGISAVLEF